MRLFVVPQHELSHMPLGVRMVGLVEGEEDGKPDTEEVSDETMEVDGCPLAQLHGGVRESFVEER
eukprot:368054-Hanusia_phi.AAC.2